MTLQVYDAEKLENLALRFLDIAAIVRGMACDLRSKKLEEIKLNDKKALLWCENLEIWVQKTKNHLDVTLKEKKRRRERPEWVKGTMEKIGATEDADSMC